MESTTAMAKQAAESAASFFNTKDPSAVEAYLQAEHAKTNATPQILWDLVGAPGTPNDVYEAFMKRNFYLDNAFPVYTIGMFHGASRFLTHLFSKRELYPWARLIIKKMSPRNIAHQLGRSSGLLIDTLLDQFPHSRDLLEFVLERGMKAVHPEGLFNAVQRERLEAYSQSIYANVCFPDRRHVIELDEIAVGAFHSVAYADVMDSFIARPRELMLLEEKARKDNSIDFFLIARCYLEKMPPDQIEIFKANIRKDMLPLDDVLSFYLMNPDNYISPGNFWNPGFPRTFYAIRALFVAGEVSSKTEEGILRFYCEGQGELLFTRRTPPQTTAGVFEDFQKIFVRGVFSRFGSDGANTTNFYKLNNGSFLRLSGIHLTYDSLNPLLGSLDKDLPSFKLRSRKLMDKVFASEPVEDNKKKLVRFSPNSELPKGPGEKRKSNNNAKN